MSYNRSYHRFFEGYVEKDVLDPTTGRMHIERVYAGDYYRHKLEDKEWKQLKVKYAVMYGIALVCFFVAGLSKNTNVWYTTIPVVLVLFGLLWLGFYVVSYICAARKLVIRQYRDREILQATAMGSAIAFGLAAISQILWMFLHSYLYGYGVFSIITDIAAAVLLYRLYKKEHEMDYIKVTNQTKVASDSYDIRYREEE